MEVRLFIGDITQAPAEAICTSTNPRLSLMMGTGGAVRERGGFSVLRECEAIIEEHFRKSGTKELPLGSVHVTGAGSLPYKRIIHCVASDSRHATSASAIRACVLNAVAAAAAEDCSSLAMPVFGAGHAHYRFDRALQLIAETLAPVSALDRVVVAVLDPAREGEAREILAAACPSFAGR
jgi:O-acetyl-ADP-ribose deacetylase (regulator of RNase III)